MSTWKFQLLPAERNVVGHGYRMDEIAIEVESKVNEALPYRFRFHGIVKIVLHLGEPPAHGRHPGLVIRDYHEGDGVAEKRVVDFCLREYRVANDDKKREMLYGAIRVAFDWLTSEFEDADFLLTARERLGWDS